MSLRKGKMKKKKEDSLIEDADEISHKQRVRKLIEERLEKKRLEEECEEEWDHEYGDDDL